MAIPTALSDGRLSCRRSVPLCIDLMKKQSETLRLHRRVADIGLKKRLWHFHAVTRLQLNVSRRIGTDLFHVDYCDLLAA